MLKIKDKALGISSTKGFIWVNSRNEDWLTLVKSIDVSRLMIDISSCSLSIKLEPRGVNRIFSRSKIYDYSLFEEKRRSCRDFRTVDY
jgi:hypothetical protein